MDKKQAIPINYIYFGLFFLILLLFSSYDIAIKHQLSGMRIFFFLYSLGQIALETSILIFTAWALSRWIGMKAKALFIGITFLILIIHIADFFLSRILDTSVVEASHLLFSDSFKNILYLLDASGIALWVWGVFFLGLSLIPLIGALLYFWSEKFTQERPIYVKRDFFFQTFFTLSISLLFWELSASPILHPDAYTTFIKSLPWKGTFLEPKNLSIAMKAPMETPPSEAKMKALMASSQVKLEQKPNIYLFVIESLREDFITKEIAPNLTRFKEQSIHFPLALSNANGTHPSWFSIFYSQFSYLWKVYQNMGWESGAPPLQLLKQWGYQIRLYTSAQLGYYGMGDLLFGKNRSLIDAAQEFHRPPPFSSADSDAQAVKTLCQDLAANQELHQGQLMITFLDATHFHYSWPHDFAVSFLPIANNLNMLQFIPIANELKKLQNRYRNAIQYVDSLFGEFLAKIPDQENAIIIVTSDHGEEYFEKGHLFHCSKISAEQTEIPLYMKLGTRKVESPPQFACHMDIFPTILHHLSDQSINDFGGSSVFAENRWPYVVISRFNGGKSPYEICLHDGGKKLILQFDNRGDILNSKSVRICSLLDAQDACIFPCKTRFKKWVLRAFDPGLLRLFPSSPEDEEIP